MASLLDGWRLSIRDLSSLFFTAALTSTRAKNHREEARLCIHCTSAYTPSHGSLEKPLHPEATLVGGAGGPDGSCGTSCRGHRPLPPETPVIRGFSRFPHRATAASLPAMKEIGLPDAARGF